MVVGVHCVFVFEQSIFVLVLGFELKVFTSGCDQTVLVIQHFSLAIGTDRQWVGRRQFEIGGADMIFWRELGKVYFCERLEQIVISATCTFSDAQLLLKKQESFVGRVIVQFEI